MNLLRRLLGRAGQNDPNWKLEHIFLFLENEAVAKLLSVSMVTKDLLAQLFPGTDLSDIQLSITSDPNLLPLKKWDRNNPVRHEDCDVSYGERITQKLFLHITYFKLARCEHPCSNAFDEQKKA